MCTHQEQHLIINISQRSYRYGNHDRTLTAGVDFGALSAIQGPPAQPTHGITQPVTFQKNTIIFYPSGIISSGTIYLTDASHSCCYALSNGVASISFLRRYVYRKTWQLMI